MTSLFVFAITTTTTPSTTTRTKMMRPSKFTKRRRDNAYKARHTIKLQAMWLDRSKQFNEFDLSNTKGRLQTEPEKS
jgi:hypothetical protein